MGSRLSRGIRRTGLSLGLKPYPVGAGGVCCTENHLFFIIFLLHWSIPLPLELIYAFLSGCWTLWNGWAIMWVLYVLSLKVVGQSTFKICGCYLFWTIFLCSWRLIWIALILLICSITFDDYIFDWCTGCVFLENGLVTESRLLVTVCFLQFVLVVAGLFECIPDLIVCSCFSQL